MNVTKLCICECAHASVGDAIAEFQNTTLPYKKAKKLVTKCSKTCCRAPLKSLYEMVKFGQIDYEEIASLIHKMQQGEI